MATVAAVALTAFEPSMALRRIRAAGKGLTAATGDQRRHRFQRPPPVLSWWRWRRGSGRLCRYRRHRYRHRGRPEPPGPYYDGWPAYYGGGPVYYGGGPAYYGGQRYYGGGGGRVYTGGPYGGGGAFDTLTPHHREY